MVGVTIAVIAAALSGASLAAVVVSCLAMQAKADMEAKLANEYASSGQIIKELQQELAEERAASRKLKQQVQNARDSAGHHRLDAGDRRRRLEEAGQLIDSLTAERDAYSKRVHDLIDGVTEAAAELSAIADAALPPTA